MPEIKSPPEELFTPEDLAELFKVSVEFVYRETSRRNRGFSSDLIPPHLKIGGRVRFLKSTAMEWLKAKEGRNGTNG